MSEFQTEQPKISENNRRDDLRWSEIYQLKEGELGFESSPSEGEYIKQGAKQMGIEVRFVPSQEFGNSDFVIMKGTHDQRNQLLDQLDAEMIERTKK